MINRKVLVNIPAAYSIWNEDICLYVGATDRLRQRITEHFSRGILKKLSNMPMEDLELNYEIQSGLEDARVREKELIKKLQPLYNLHNKES